VASRRNADKSNSGRFRRQSRLLKHADFDRVYREGRRHFASNMTLFYLLQSEEHPSGPRVGFTVGRALGGAVQRNRLKRRMREAVRVSLGKLPLPLDVVINPKRSAAATDFFEIQTEVQQAFQAIQQRLRKSSTLARPAGTKR
jgi:ribonuclease P protein component